MTTFAKMTKYAAEQNFQLYCL